MMPTLEEDDVLQTRIVSVPELLSEKDKWHDTISGEMRQLFEEKQALVKLSDQDLEALKVKWGKSLIAFMGPHQEITLSSRRQLFYDHHPF